MARNPRHLMQVQERQSGVHAEHPYVNEANHELLLQYCKERIDLSRASQSFFRDRFTEIDREFYGYMVLSKEDRIRKLKQIQGISTSPTEMRASFVASQMMRMVTFLVSVFSPDSGIYEVVTDENNQQLGTALTTLMNNHATKGAYFREQAKFFLDALKYNLAAFEADWFVESGKKLADRGAGVRLEDTTLFEGNKIKSLDMYNTFWAPMIQPMDVYRNAEYAGYLDLVSHYELKKDTQDGKIFNTKDIWELPQSINRTNSWYYNHPAVRYDVRVEDGIGAGGYDWVHILSQGTRTTNSLSYYERCTLYIRLIPSEFGLVPRTAKKTRNKFEIWRIRIINGSHIVQCEHVPNVHDYIPMFFCRPLEDNMGNQSKSATEMMSMFQIFANFLLNTHIKSARKNLYDLTIFDPSVVNLSDLEDDVAARIPMLPGGYGKDPKASVWRPDSRIDTKETMQQIQLLLELMEYIFPTRMLQQVGQIDRAIGEQISALLAAAYRDSWKLARMIDEQAMSPMRFTLVSNIKQFQTEMMVSTAQGKVPLSPTALRNTDFEFKIGEGLKMIDRLTLMSAIADVLNKLLQSQAIQQVDALGLVNWYAKLAGNETDLTRFRLQTPATPPSQQNSTVGQQTQAPTNGAAVATTGAAQL